jgi:carboxymethylenebutenolidase
MSEVEIPTKSGPMPGYLATPAGAGPFPGVVVIHDVVGMGPDLRHQADWLASEGFLAVVPDLFHWGTKFRCLRSVWRVRLVAGAGPWVRGVERELRTGAQGRRSLLAGSLPHRGELRRP